MNQKKKYIEEKSSKIRESNFELMRIISMFFIVIYHILLHGGLFARTYGSTKIIITLIETIILVHVNSFILITGYFQCKSTRKASKIISIINKTWFYKVIIMFILIGIGFINTPSNIEILHVIFPIDYGTYWFVNCYLILYLISPILNKVITNSNKKEMEHIIILLFFIISLLSTFTKDVVFNTFLGRSLSTFILLYFIGAYLRLYPLEKTILLNKFTPKARRLLYLIGFVTFSLISFLVWTFMMYSLLFDPIIKGIGNICKYIHGSYASPIVLFQSIFYFLFFSTLNIKNKFINKISETTLGVYLIHENIYLRNTLYNKIGLTQIIVTNQTIIYIIFLAVTIYVICTIIELIRHFIFKLIYRSKIATKNRKRYQNYFKELNLHINW